MTSKDQVVISLLDSDDEKSHIEEKEIVDLLRGDETAAAALPSTTTGNSSTAGTSARIMSTGKRKFTHSSEDSPIDKHLHTSLLYTHPSGQRKTTEKRKWQPFYLTTVPALSAEHNRHCLSVTDLFHQDEDNLIQEVLLMNYMIDIEWMLEEAPALWGCQSVLCLHGSSVDPHIQLDHWTIAKVDMGREQYGTHHSKIALIKYQIGLRIVITTANFIAEDFTFRTQGIYVQDFPPKHASSNTSTTTETVFERDFISYLEQVHASTKAETVLHQWIQTLKQYDFTSAEVVLLPSVPGRFTHQARYHWGIGKLHKTLLDENLLSEEEAYDSTDPRQDRLVVQCSSIGTMGKDAKLVQDYLHRMYFQPKSTHKKGKNIELELKHADIVWPTLQCVKDSFQGYASGGSIPCAAKNMYNMDLVNASHHFQLINVQNGFQSLLRYWDGTPSGRQRATPHMKCYFRYHYDADDEIEMRWFLLTSKNLSQAAWGVFQSQESQLYIKSYEMGVLFIPNKIKTMHRIFSCTPHHAILGIDDIIIDKRHVESSQFMVSMNPQEVSFDNIHKKVRIPFPVPFHIPPRSYQQGKDQPWVWDIPFPHPDCLGNTRS